MRATDRLMEFLGAALLLMGTLNTVLAAERFGGVEIGAKGVKTAAVEVDSNGPSLKELKLDKKTVDVTIARLKDQKFEKVLVGDVAEVVKDFITALRDELGIPEKNIQVIASSGVPFADNFADLTKAIFDKTGMKVSKLDPVEEAMLTTVAIVPKAQWSQTIVMDIGSGNTKGGEFLNDSGKPDGFAAYSVPYGTVTLGKEIEKRATEAGTTRAVVGLDVSRQLVGNPLRQMFAAKTVRTAQPKKALFAGGSVWAMVTIMKPETALEPFPHVTAADLRDYAALINKTLGQYPEVDFARIADPKAREAAQADYDKIRGAGGATPIFTPDDLFAGSLLLNQVGDALDFSTRPVLFDRKAVTAWITAYITPSRYWSLLPQALGRDVPQPKAQAVSGAAGAVGGSVSGRPFDGQPVTKTLPAPSNGSPAYGLATDDPSVIARNPTIDSGPCGCCGWIENDPCCGGRGNALNWGSDCGGCGGGWVTLDVRPQRGGIVVVTPPTSYVVRSATVVPRPSLPARTALNAAEIASRAVKDAELAATKGTNKLASLEPFAHAPESATAGFLGEQHFGQGSHYFWRGDYSAAREHFDSAVSANSRDARYWYLKGLCESRLGDKHRALDSLATGVALELQNLPDARVVSKSLERLQGSERLMLRDAVVKARARQSGRPSGPPVRDRVARSAP